MTAAVILLMASIASAVPEVIVVYNETDLGGSWRYDYTIYNVSTEGEALHEVYFYFTQTAPVTGISLPSGWNGLPWTGEYISSYLNAYSTEFPYDIISGGSLGGFSFTIDYRAGNISYDAHFSGDKIISYTTAVCLFPFYRDADGDGYGNPGDTVQACISPEGYVEDNTDCNDSLASVNPSTHWYRDADGDGYGNPGDTVQACIAPDGYVANNSDCDDSLASINLPPLWYRDADGDGYGNPGDMEQTCIAPEGYVANNTDCNDYLAAINPLTFWYGDRDEDGFGDPEIYLQQCTAPSASIQYVLNNLDYNDGNPTIGPSVKLTGASSGYYRSIQAAYAAASSGNTIKAAVATIIENLDLNQNKSVTIDGGYNWTFTSNPGSTTIQGNMSVTNGALTIRGINLQ